MLTSSSDGVPVLEPRNVVRRRFAMTLGVALIVGLIALLLSRAGTNDRVIGSGSTAVQPLVEKLAVNFQNERSGDDDWIAGSTGLDYEPVGSLGGVMRLEDPEVDFAIADYPLSAEALRKIDAVQFPIVISSVSVIYNLGSGTPRPLRFRATTLAGIFSGRITTWNDGAIAADNPGVPLPALKITVVHRSDGSGSTLNWSTYLARGDAAWQQQTGTGTTLKWPVGMGVKGSEGMAKAVAGQQGAIGYIATSQARRANLATAAVQNGSGQFVEANEASISAAASTLDLASDSVAPSPGHAPEAYPVTAASYIVMKRKNAASADNDRALRFFSFLLDHGSSEARKLGYLPLSGSIVADVRRIWAREFGFNAVGLASATN